jgi:hypothetical protein
MSRLAAVAWVVVAAALAGGCGDEGESEQEVRAPAPSSAPPAAPPVAACPVELANCRSASGRILYVERVDPDGDGDAHFVLLSDESITAPGVSIIDVRSDLRPNPLPGPGDRISAAGPVYSGTAGQKQIEAVVVRTAG